MPTRRMLDGLGGRLPDPRERGTRWRWIGAATALAVALGVWQLAPLSIPKPLELARGLHGHTNDTAAVAAQRQPAATPVIVDKSAEPPAAAVMAKTSAPAAEGALAASAAEPTITPTHGIDTPLPTVARAKSPAPTSRDAITARKRPAAPRTAPEPSAATAAAPTEARDRDAELIAALMAHAAPRVAPAATTLRSGIERPSPVRGTGATDKPVEPAVRARLDQRVQRCKQLDGRDAVVACRRKVCEQHWGRVAACPVKLMPAAAAVHAGVGDSVRRIP
jgi:hypothetical protein